MKRKKEKEKQEQQEQQGKGNGKLTCIYMLWRERGGRDGNGE